MLAIICRPMPVTDIRRTTDGSDSTAARALYALLVLGMIVPVVADAKPVRRAVPKTVAVRSGFVARGKSRDPRSLESEFMQLLALNKTRRNKR